MNKIILGNMLEELDKLEENKLKKEDIKIEKIKVEKIEEETQLDFDTFFQLKELSE